MAQLMKACPVRMRSSVLNKMIAVVLLVAVVAIAGNGRCFALDAGNFLQSSYEKADKTLLKACCGDEAPCCPTDNDSASDHCSTCFSCPCSAPLSSHGALVSYAPLIASISFLEHRNAPPDVYLSIFVPPQILA